MAAWPSADALVVEGLSKSFNGLKAVDGVNLRVRTGEVFGFLGPNGAGKTTTIKMLLGIAKPDAGSILIDGRDLSREPHEIKRRVGFLPERVAFYPNLTAKQTVAFYAQLKGQADVDLDGSLKKVGLLEFADKKVGTFSKGMVQLLGIAQALLGKPSILILDEPSTGLDPNWARTLKDLVLEANRAGATVFFSSHILSEVQELASRVAILNRGRVVAQDSVAKLSLSTKVKPRLHLLIFERRDEAVAILKGVPGVEDVTVDREIIVTCGNEVKGLALNALMGAGISVQNFRTVDPSLEDVFLQFTESSRGAVR